jgi:hypothetical protein
MSDSQTVWTILWERASKGPDPREPFEVSEVVPQVINRLNVPEEHAARLVRGLMMELGRMPEGRQYFTLEGDAIVPLPEFARDRGKKSPLDAYPYEL